MGNRTEAVKEAAAALGDLWRAQNTGDQGAQQAALERGHAALRGTQTPAAK